MTAPPMIDLRPLALDAPNKLDVAAVEAMMLWPENPTARERWAVAAMREWGWRHLDDMTDPHLREWVEFARAKRNWPRLEDLQPEVGQRWKYGIIAGAVVFEAVILGELAPDRAQLGAIRARLADRLKGTMQIEPRTMNNRAGPIFRFRAVAHLWAAYIIASEGGETEFPCKIASLGRFLATAEAIRARAEQSRVKRSPALVMRPGEAVRLPPEIAARLPIVTLPEYALVSCPDQA